MIARAKKTIEQLVGQPNPLHNKDFLLTWDHDDATLRYLLALVEALELLYRAGQDLRVFSSGMAVSNFRDKSTRTLFSFASASNLLGLQVKDLEEGKSQISHGETVRETATMISFLTQVLGIRDDMYIHEGHAYMLETAAALEESYGEGILAQRPAVINLQCDVDHPTQTLADLAHLSSTFDGMEALRGKKLAMTWAYSPSYGKPLSVPQGIIGLMTRFGMKVVLAHPEGYDLLPETLEVARANAQKSGGSFSLTNSMAEAFTDADIVYPKSWASYHVMEERVALRYGPDAPSALAALEQRCLGENAQHTAWECNHAMMARTRGGQALYMHCLPADISGVSCEKGEVSAEVFERYRLQTYSEAGHKPFVIAAMILMTRFADPAATVRQRLARP